MVMAIQTLKFSQMTAGGNIANNNTFPGLLSGENVLFNVPWTFLPPGSTAARPIPVPAIYGLLRYNTDNNFYEYYDVITSMWVELSGSGTGTVNPGIANAIAYYAASGTAVSPIDSLPNSVFITNGSGVPSFSTSLPSGISIPGAIITSSTAALISGQVSATPVNPTDLVNKAYVDSSFASGVTSLTGTTNQIIFSSSTGNITASLPQNIAVGSTPTFAGMTLSSIPLGSASGGTGINNGSNTLTLGGTLTTSGAYNSTFTMTGATSVTFPTSGTLATTSQIPSVTPSALTSSNDTNVTITLGGTPNTALLQATSITMGWTGLLSPARGGTGVNNGTNTLTLGGNTAFSGAFTFTGTLTANTAVTFPVSGILATTSQLPTPAALTSSNDTNVTITLGGTPSTALLQATSITMGWSGQLSLTRGGTNASLTASNGGIVYSSASSLAILSGTATSNQLLLSGASTTPQWSTTTYPLTNAINTILYASSANVMAALATGNNGVLITSNAGVPSWLANGTAGYVLTANSGAPPSWQNISAEGAVTAVDTDSGNITPSAGVITISGGTTGLTTVGSAATVTLTGTLKLANGGTNANLTASNGGIFYSSATAGAILSGTATAGLALISGASGAPSWGQGILTTNSPTFAGLTLTNPYIAGAGGLHSFQVFTSGTAATYTKPSNVTSILIEVIGGGGGGGGSTGGTSTTSCGAGGGGGGYARLWVPSAAATYTYTVGAGGSAGSAGNNAGGVGGTTTFSASSLQATGGGGGNGMATISVTTVGGATGGSPGVGSNGNINVQGQPGSFSFTGFNNTIQSGSGGSSHYGGGGMGGAGAATAGGNYGGGGSGGGSLTTSTAGAAGAPGLIVVWEFA
jgi:hypothetical protein